MENEKSSEINLNKLLERLNIENYPDLAEQLVQDGKINDAKNVMAQYEVKQSNPLLRYISLGNFYNIKLRDFKSAIPYYEEFIKFDSSKSVIYTILADLYLKAYGEKSRQKQLYYWGKANALRPGDRLILHGLAFCSEKLGKTEDAKKYYEQLLQNNPTPTDYFNYGSLLIHHGDFLKGHRYFAYRNLIKDDVFKNTLTPDIQSIERLKENLSDKTLLVHYEQGFGDTIMYSRFLPQLKNRAKKVIFVLQEQLIDLFKNSNIFDGIELCSDKEDLNGIKYDIPVMLLDVPYILDTTSENLPYKDGYLRVFSKLSSEYAKKYLADDKIFKIGISYSGDKNANYIGRDVDIERFLPISGLKGVRLYSLQKDYDKSIAGIINLGQTFNNFTDTACAVDNMDLIVSTDNVILNLAGALGTKTIGLFNKQTNFRWFKQSFDTQKSSVQTNDTGWYSSVYALQAQKQDDWNGVFDNLFYIIQNVLLYSC